MFKATEFSKIKKLANERGIYLYRSKSVKGKYCFSRWGHDQRYYSNLKTLKKIIMTYPIIWKEK